jgi:hypothetical protein
MHQPIQCNTIPNSIGCRLPLRRGLPRINESCWPFSHSPPLRGLLLIPLLLACFALSQTARAVSPPPDGGYAGNNTAEGTNALLNLTSGINNTAVGLNALLHDTSGGYNVGIGSQALALNSTGNFNMAIGTQALFNNTASANMAVGFRVLFNNTTGSDLTGIGTGALFANTTGNENTAIGSGALLSNTTGASNTAVGRQALNRNTTGDDNTAVGLQALEFNTSVTNVAVGTFAAQNTDNAFNTAVGGFALKANTAGTANTVVGAGAMESGDGGNDNTAVGELAGNNITGNSNTCLGHSTGSNLTGGEGNIYIGAEVQAGGTGEFEFIRIGSDTAFTFPYDTFIAGIQNRVVSASGHPHFVMVDDNGKLGTISADVIANKIGNPLAVPQRVQPQAIGPDPKQVMLNRKVEKLQSTVAQQQKQIEILTTQLKEQAAQIQKVSAQLELNKRAPRTVANK